MKEFVLAIGFLVLVFVVTFPVTAGLCSTMMIHLVPQVAAVAG